MLENKIIVLKSTSSDGLEPEEEVLTAEEEVIYEEEAMYTVGYSDGALRGGLLGYDKGLNPLEGFGGDPDTFFNLHGLGYTISEEAFKSLLEESLIESKKEEGYQVKTAKEEVIYEKGFRDGFRRAFSMRYKDGMKEAFGEWYWHGH